MTIRANGNWKVHLRKSLQALRPEWGSGTVTLKTTISKTTLTQLTKLVPFGPGGLGGAVTDMAIRLFLCLMQPDGKAAEKMGLQLGKVLSDHPDLVERITENMTTLLDNLNVEAEEAGIEMPGVGDQPGP